VTRPIRLLTDRTGDPARDTAVARSLLRRVASGDLGETFRLTVPGRIVAFGRQDTVRPGYPAAIGAATSLGFAPIERLAGGRAAVFHEGTLAFSWAMPDPEPAARIHARFQELADLMVDALRRLGVDARIGEVPGEYCPGAYSVSIGGRRKVMGVGQRLARTAAHIGGVVVATGAGLVNEVIEPVYDALGYDWDPDATGAIEDAAAVAVTDVQAAILDALADRYEITVGTLDAATLDLADRLAEDHVAGSR
jgi:lipoate-protein ligase A